LEASKFLDHAEAARCGERSDDFVFSTLIVSGRSEASQRRTLEFDALKITVKGEIEVESSLLAVGDDIKTGRHLVVNGSDDCVFLKFRAVGFAELIEVVAGEFEPAGEWIAADDGGAEGHRNR
jgi:hypothetical protein